MSTNSDQVPVRHFLLAKDIKYDVASPWISA